MSDTAPQIPQAQEEEHYDVWFVLYDGVPEGIDVEEGDTWDTHGVAFPGSMEDFARKSFDSNIANGFASRAEGMFLDKISGVRPEHEPALENDAQLNAIIIGGFKDFTVERLLTYKTTFADWAPEAFEDDDGEDGIPEGAVITEDGWEWEQHWDNPYSGEKS